MSQYPNQPPPGPYPPYQQPPQGQPPFQYPQQPAFPPPAWQQPMQQQYPPPPPQPPQRKKNWIRRHPLWSALIALLLLSCIVGALNDQSSGTTAATSNANASPTVASTQPASVPTVQPTLAPTIQPTAKTQQVAPTQPAPATTEQARLGASLDAFIAKYGQPNDHTDKNNGSYHFARIPGENTDGIILNTDILDSGYSQKVMDVTANAPDGGWTKEQSDQACLSLLPLDARYKNRVQLNSTSGYDIIYSSTSLAHAFPADAFTDSNNNPTTPGLFDVQYLTNQNGTINDCELMVGTQQEI